MEYSEIMNYMSDYLNLGFTEPIPSTIPCSYAIDEGEVKTLVN